ncbi:hypothetical protein B0T16DRAFT_141820 [Cercophora newfieldiana]|uniref:Uncharacterized protein n=1 Tax=Cercophora newfieldiana TaxID=92897 RepID=A0AA39Y515_9PEZI|nr:hypothetical protein B0T16DRAFT_141820 [Cercophora newfieldiana]
MICHTTTRRRCCTSPSDPIGQGLKKAVCKVPTSEIGEHTVYRRFEGPASRLTGRTRKSFSLFSPAIKISRNGHRLAPRYTTTEPNPAKHVPLLQGACQGSRSNQSMTRHDILPRHAIKRRSGTPKVRHTCQPTRHRKQIYIPSPALPRGGRCLCNRQASITSPTAPDHVKRPGFFLRRASHASSIAFGASKKAPDKFKKALRGYY